MPQASGDPDELERFARSLQTFLETIREAEGRISHDFASLGDSWRDEKRAAFEDEFACLRQQLLHFDSSAREQIPYLNALAGRLRDYLGC